MINIPSMIIVISELLSIVNVSTVEPPMNDSQIRDDIYTKDTINIPVTYYTLGQPLYKGQNRWAQCVRGSTVAIYIID